jgi:vacuolar protein sorting-associated protein 13A/C
MLNLHLTWNVTCTGACLYVGNTNFKIKFDFCGSLQGPNVPNVSFLVNIHEPIIWRLHEMFHRLSLGRLRSSQTTAVAIDPIIRIG